MTTRFLFQGINTACWVFTPGERHSPHFMKVTKLSMNLGMNQV